MGGKLRLDGAALAIRQEGHGATPLQAADQRAVALPAAERPVVGADSVQGHYRPLGPAPHGLQHRDPARQHHELAGEAGCRPATKREAEMMDDAVQPSCALSVDGGEIRFEQLGEDLRPAFCSDDRNRRTPIVMTTRLPATG